MLRNMLDFAKHPIEKKHQQGVYAIPCSCEKVYIGETGRPIKAQQKEHGVVIHHCKTKNSTIVKHSCNTQHQIYLEKVEVLATISHYFKRKLRKALKIEKHPNNINCDEGLKQNKKT